MMKLLFSIFLSVSVSAQSYMLGEKLEYKIIWGFMDVGTSVMSVLPEPVEYNGVMCHVFKSMAKSHGFMDSMYHVDDKIVSYFDPVTGRTMSAAKRIHEGKFHREYHADFDHKLHAVSWWSKHFKGKQPDGENQRFRSGLKKEIPGFILDALSAIYYTRNHSEEPVPGKEFTLPVYDDLEVTTLQITVLREEEIELTVNGVKKKYQAFVAKPFIPTSGIFKSEGEILIWISKDKRRIPLKIQSKVNIGNVTVELDKAENLIEEEPLETGK